MTIPFVHENEATYGAAQDRSPLVRRVLANNPSPFTYWGTGTFIIGTGQKGQSAGSVAVIDPGPALPDHVEAILAAIGDQTISHILITHTHMDHSPAAALLQDATGAKTYGFGRHGSGRAKGKDGGLAGETVEAGADNDFRPDERLADGDIIAGEGWTLEALHTPGHTSNHLCFALREENALFSGDHIMGWSTTVISPPDGDMTAYMDSLGEIEALKFDRLHPTHGPAITDPATFIAALIRHRHDREAEVLQAVRGGTGKIEDMVLAIYTELPDYLRPAAARSVLAHLIRLGDQGNVQCDGDIGLDAHFTA